MGFTKLIGVRQNMISDKGGRGVSQFQIFSDTGGMGGRSISDFWLTRGGGGVWTPPFLDDIICEQPLTVLHISSSVAIAFFSAEYFCRFLICPAKCRSSILQADIEMFLDQSEPEMCTGCLSR